MLRNLFCILYLILPNLSVFCGSAVCWFLVHKTYSVWLGYWAQIPWNFISGNFMRPEFKVHSSRENLCLLVWLLMLLSNSDYFNFLAWVFWEELGEESYRGSVSSSPPSVAMQSCDRNNQERLVAFFFPFTQSHHWFCKYTHSLALWSKVSF